MTNFDCLNTELLFEVFDYLSFTDLFRAFFNLQRRINNAIRTYPACIDLSKTADRKALIHSPFLCRALIVVDDDSESNQIDFLHFNFSAIRAIDLKHVNFTTFQSLSKQLPMQQLESITIDSIDRQNGPKDIDEQIWSIISIAGRNQLRHLRTSLRIIRWNLEQLLFDLPSLKYVIFKDISAKEMLAFVRHTPNLRSLTGRITSWSKDIYASDFSCLKLTYLELHIESCGSFKELRQLLSVCPYLTEFILRFWITENNISMVDATGWQTLVEQCLPCLIYLKIRLFRYIQAISDSDDEDTFDLSEYWLRRQPNYDIQLMSSISNYITTMDLIKNNPNRSDDNMANKRMKTNHADNQLLDFSKPNIHHSIAQQAITDRVNKIDRTRTLQTDIIQEHTTIVKGLRNCLETLPNELFFHIFSYMNHTDVVRTFFGLNQRFNSLTFECVRQFQVLDETSLTWYIEYLSRIENAIEMISLGVKSIPNVFSCNHSYPNLRTIILKHQFSFSVRLNVEHYSGLGAIISCLNLLRLFSTWTLKDFEITPLFEIEPIERTPNARIDTFLNTLPCLAIERLSVYVWDPHDWICLCGRAPNLTHLQIIYDEPVNPNITINPGIITTLISGPSHLTDVHINCGYNQVSLESIEWLISHCQSSLKQFTFSSSDSNQIDGKCLETLLQPCRQLTKIVFDIEFDSDEISMMEVLRQFQTDWWLDKCRPPVFLHHNADDRILIVTMPCTSLKYITLGVDPTMWLLNKGQLDSPLIYFSKVASINILNNSRQPITLEFLRLIGYMFRSSYQCLKFSFWGFHRPQIIYEQVNNTAEIIPRLPHVTYLSMNYTECCGLDAMSLVTWLLVAPNVKELNITQMPNENKFQLAKDLERMLQTDQYLKLVFNRIDKIVIFSSYNKSDDPTKMKLFFLFLELFPEAVIHYL